MDGACLMGCHCWREELGVGGGGILHSSLASSWILLRPSGIRILIETQAEEQYLCPVAEVSGEMGAC